MNSNSKSNTDLEKIKALVEKFESSDESDISFTDFVCRYISLNPDDFNIQNLNDLNKRITDYLTTYIALSSLAAQRIRERAKYVELAVDGKMYVNGNWIDDPNLKDIQLKHIMKIQEEASNILGNSKK